MKTRPHTHPTKPRFAILLLAGPLATVALAAALGGSTACEAADAAPLNPFEQAAAKPTTAPNPFEQAAQGAAQNPFERATQGSALNPFEQAARGGTATAAENPFERQARLAREELARQEAIRQEMERLELARREQQRQQEVELARQKAVRQENERLELARQKEADRRLAEEEADLYALGASGQIPASQFSGPWAHAPTGDYTPGAASPGGYQSGQAGFRASRDLFEQSQARGWENMQREEKQLRDSIQRTQDQWRNQAEQRRQQQQSDQRRQDIFRKFGR